MNSSNKRKRSAPHAETRPETVDRRAPDSDLASVQQYPRKRISVACNLCRFRKTKCDAVRPSCSFCTDLGVDCRYRSDESTPVTGRPRRPVSKSKDDAPTSEAIKDLEFRLRDLEGQVRDLRTERWMPSNASMGPASEVAVSPTMPTAYGSPTATYIRPRSHRSSNSRFTFRLGPGKGYTARPSMLQFFSPPYIHAESYDDSAEFYASQINEGEYFYAQFDRFLGSMPDLGSPTVRKLEQSFVDNCLAWIPLFSPHVVTDAIQHLETSPLGLPDTKNCLAMFVLAIGGLASGDPELEDGDLPGIQYFTHGSHTLNRLTFLVGNIDVLHCRILQAIYFKLAMRPVQAWTAITQAARDCMNALSSSLVRGATPEGKELWHRTFWACSIILEELETCMKLHTVGHRVFHDSVPLPHFENEDTAFYFFLSQISLRKMLVSVLDVVGYREGKVIYAPVLTAELRKQAQEWHEQLPATISFPVDDSPVLDARKSYLRSQYLSMRVVLGWASVLRVFEIYASAGDGDVEPPPPEELEIARAEAQECFRYCTLYFSVAEEQLRSWNLGTNMCLWTCFAWLVTLIICYRSPALAFIPETTDDTYVRRTYQLLRVWKHIPFVSRGLERLSSMMERAGMELDYARIKG